MPSSTGSAVTHSIRNASKMNIHNTTPFHTGASEAFLPCMRTHQSSRWFRTVQGQPPQHPTKKKPASVELPSEGSKSTPYKVHPRKPSLPPFLSLSSPPPYRPSLSLLLFTCKKWVSLRIFNSESLTFARILSHRFSPSLSLRERFLRQGEKPRTNY